MFVGAVGIPLSVFAAPRHSIIYLWLLYYISVVAPRMDESKSATAVYNFKNCFLVVMMILTFFLGLTGAEKAGRNPGSTGCNQYNLRHTAAASQIFLGFRFCVSFLRNKKYLFSLHGNFNK